MLFCAIDKLDTFSGPVKTVRAVVCGSSLALQLAELLSCAVDKESAALGASASSLNTQKKKNKQKQKRRAKNHTINLDGPGSTPLL
jgi:hypothetical protein